MGELIKIGNTYNEVRFNHAKRDLIYFLNNFHPQRGSGKLQLYQANLLNRIYKYNKDKE